MGWIRSRARRVRGFTGVVVGLVLGSVALVTALFYWYEKLGTLGIAVVGALGFAAFLAVVVLPEAVWERLTTDPQAAAAAEAITALLNRLKRERDQLPQDSEPVTDEELGLAKATLTETLALVDGTYPQHVHALGAERIRQVGKRAEDPAGHGHDGMRERYRWAIVTLDNVLKDLRREGGGA